MAATVHHPSLRKGTHRKKSLSGYKKGFRLFFISFVLVITVLTAVGAVIKLHSKVSSVAPRAGAGTVPRSPRATPVPVSTAPLATPVVFSWVMTMELPTAGMFTCADKSPANSGNSLFWAAFAECMKAAGVTKAAVVMWTYSKNAI